MTLFTMRSCRKKEFEIMHAHGTISGLSAACGWLIGRVPFVVSFHQDALIGWETGYNLMHGIRYHFTRFLQARICDFAAVVTAQSPAVKEITERVLGLNGKTRIAVLPNAVDVTRFSMASSPPARNRSVLFVGNLIKRKGVDVLLRSMTILVASFPDVTLTVVGGGPEKRDLQNLARDLGVSAQVSFLDEVDDKTLASLYQSSAVVVLPSYSEVFGVVILEAMAANRPVVATATVGAMSIIADGTSGLVVPIGDAQAIASAIASLFSDYGSAVAIARQGHQLVLAKYSVDAVSEDLERLYRSATRSSNGSKALTLGVLTANK